MMPLEGNIHMSYKCWASVEYSTSFQLNGRYYDHVCIPQT